MIFKSKLKQPINFIVCGTQKGGTTALDYYLRSHKQICMALKKEVHFSLIPLKALMYLTSMAMSI